MIGSQGLLIGLPIYRPIGLCWTMMHGRGEIGAAPMSDVATLLPARQCGVWVFFFYSFYFVLFYFLRICFDSTSTRADSSRFLPNRVFNSQEPAYTKKAMNHANSGRTSRVWKLLTVLAVQIWVLFLVLTPIVDASNHHEMLLDLYRSHRLSSSFMSQSRFLSNFFASFCLFAVSVFVSTLRALELRGMSKLALCSFSM